MRRTGLSLQSFGFAKSISALSLAQAKNKQPQVVY
jgi:hypothetical protein